MYLKSKEYIPQADNTVITVFNWFEGLLPENYITLQHKGEMETDIVSVSGELMGGMFHFMFIEEIVERNARPLAGVGGACL